MILGTSGRTREAELKNLLFAIVSVLGLLAGLSDSARAYTLPNGNIVWDLSTADHDIRLEVFAGGHLGSMTLTTRATGVSQIGSINPALVQDRDASAGGADEFIGEGLFDPFPSLVVDITLVDLDGVAFDGALSSGSPGDVYQLIPATPPPLSMFETANVNYRVQYIDQFGNNQFGFFTEAITALPEPGAALLVGVFVAATLLLRR